MALNLAFFPLDMLFHPAAAYFWPSVFFFFPESIASKLLYLHCVYGGWFSFLIPAYLAAKFALINHGVIVDRLRQKSQSL